MPLNYYLKHNLKAPAPVPSNDLDIKVEFGDYMRSLLAERQRAVDCRQGRGARRRRRSSRPASTSRAMFVEYAKEPMGQGRGGGSAEKITSELKPLGIGIGPQAVRVPRRAAGDKPPLHLVPLGRRLPTHVRAHAARRRRAFHLESVTTRPTGSRQGRRQTFPTVTVPQP